MSPLELGGLFFVVTIGLIMLRLPVGVAMLLIGGLGYVLLNGWDPLLNFLKTMAYGRVSNFTLTVIPLFLLMGQLGSKSGINKSLYAAARAWLGHLRGGLAVATIGGCAAFGAICGSSTATAVTMAQVALPELRRYGYAPSLATGTLAAGGTLGILIPPSLILVIYAVIAETSILDLFIAAIVPGILATALYMAAIAVVVRLRPEAGPAAERIGWRQRFVSLRGVWPVALTFFLVLYGMYQGWFSATEGAAVGAALVGLHGAAFGGMRWPQFREALIETGRTTAMIFLILIGAEIYNSFLALSQLPTELADTVQGLGWSPHAVIAVILLIYLVLGCIMDALSMILLTVPVFLPVVLGLDLGLSYDATIVWFGIIAVVVVEVGLITPPIGLNVFVINAMARDVPMLDTFRGVVPFLFSDFVRIALLVAFPGIALWLTGLT